MYIISFSQAFLNFVNSKRYQCEKYDKKNEDKHTIHRRKGRKSTQTRNTTQKESKKKKDHKISRAKRKRKTKYQANKRK